ncbi:hypothetical protein BFP78_02915 [Gaetbulibacter sp. 5U11]|jgi:hypothetical protein|nr:hypothetical protein BFP78_02915 [Gaetbulibacter sp. 5U11]|tara:strand:- start:307941 stop:308135 length:195 start_codon:yes stop_codon:yes gene_type:complete
MLQVMILNISGSTILLLLFIFYGVPIIATIIALSLRNKKRKTAKVIGILTAVYVLISLGYCGIL